MGCGIHSIAEKRNPQTGRWELLGNIFRKGYHQESKDEPEFINKPFSWRNYFIFSFLANVRNSYDYKCISPPKGLPTDSDYLNSICEDEYRCGETNRDDILNFEDNYAHSFLTVNDLISYDYEKEFVVKHHQPDLNKLTTNYKTLLGKDFFEDLEILKRQGNPEVVRIVFWFSN